MPSQPPPTATKLEARALGASLVRVDVDFPQWGWSFTTSPDEAYSLARKLQLAADAAKAQSEQSAPNTKTG